MAEEYPIWDDDEEEWSEEELELWLQWLETEAEMLQKRRITEAERLRKLHARAPRATMAEPRWLESIPEGENDEMWDGPPKRPPEPPWRELGEAGPAPTAAATFEEEMKKRLQEEMWETGRVRKVLPGIIPPRVYKKEEEEEEEEEP